MRRVAAASLALGVVASLAVTLSVPSAAVDGLPSTGPALLAPPPVPLPVFPLVPEPAPVEKPAPVEDESRGNDKVTLCHASSSASNPYQLITVSVSALNGHDGHTGPVFDPATNQSGDTWGDIIPAVGDYPGMNISGAGAEILANGCAVPAPPVDPSTPVVPITPTVPTKPGKPTPVKPITPTVPTKPGKPTPVKPITPTVPVRPGFPQVPVVPGLPGTDRFLVVFCHATGSTEAPYRRTTAWAASLAELQHDIELGHGQHSGPVFDPNTDVEGGGWGDVIPAFGDYPGLNNTGAGAEIVANGCDVPPSVGVDPVAWNICHWDTTASPPAYEAMTVSADSTEDLLAILGQHAVESGANGEQDVIPTTREGSANLVCPGPQPPATPTVSVTVVKKARMCHAEDGVYATRFEVAMESASGADAATARASASALASARLVEQLRYHSRRDRADVIEPFDTFDGFHWGLAGQRIMNQDCVVTFVPRNPNLLRPLPGVVTERPGASAAVPQWDMPASGK